MTDATRVCGWRPVCDSSSFLRRETMRRRSRMSKDDVLFGYRLRLFALAGEIGVRAACRAMGVHHSTYYRWAEKVERWGLEALRPRERRRPRMPNQLGPHLEQRIVAFALGQPGFGPARISAELAREKWGGLKISSNRGVAGPEAPRPQHAAQAARVGRRLRRRLRAKACGTRAGAPRRGLEPRRAGRARLLLRRSALRNQGHGLAVHRDRRRLRLRMGRAAHDPAQPGSQARDDARQPGRLRARRGRLEARARDHR